MAKNKQWSVVAAKFEGSPPKKGHFNESSSTLFMLERQSLGLHKIPVEKCMLENPSEVDPI